MATFSINATARRVVATGTGGTGPFPFTFQVNSQSELAVYVDATLKTLTTHYTVSLNGDGTGSVSFTAGNFPTTSQTVTILGNTPLSRTSVYTSGGNITATALETDFDTNVMVQQQQQDLIDRALVGPINDPTTLDMTLPAASTRATKILAFDSSGNPVASTSTLSSIETSAPDAAASATAAANSATEAAASAATVSTAAAYAAAYVDNYAAGVDFTAGSSTTITLTQSVNDEKYVHIYFDGVHQHHNTYTVSSGTVTFDAAIPSGVTNIEAAYGIRTSVPLNGIHDLTTAEVDQLENIGSSTISAAQWGYVGNLNQDLASDDNVTFNNVTVAGDLTINGSTVQLDVTNLEIDDNLILVNNGVAAGANANDAGILIERGSTGNNAVFVWDESADGFIVGTTTATGSATGNLTITAADFTAAAITGTTLTTTGSITSNPASGANILFQNGSGTAVGRVTFDSTNLKVRGDSSKGLKLGSNGSDVIEIDTSSISTFSGDIRISSGNALYSDSTNSSTVLAGGNADNAGGNIILRGQSHSTEANFLKFRNGTTDALIINGSQLATFAGDINFSATTTNVSPTTSDASDNARVFFNGGGAASPSRGSFVGVYGNENSDTGRLLLSAGDVSGGDIEFHTGNSVERARITQGGNFGIGSSSPNYPLTIHSTGDGIKFEVSDTVDANYRIQVSGSDIITGPSTASDLAFQTHNTTRMTVTSSGDVGIGESSPSLGSGSSGLHITSSQHARIKLESGADDESGIQFTEAGTDQWRIAYDAASNHLEFTESGVADRMVIQDGGNVGIGTSSPVATLQIKTQTNGNAAFQNSTSAAGGVKINAFNDAASASVPFEIDGSSLQFNIAAVEKMRIDSSGNVGIGTTAPGELLTLSNATPVLRFVDSDTSSEAQIVSIDGNLRFDADNANAQASTNIAFRTDGTERVRIDSSGDVGIGTSTATYRLTVEDSSADWASRIYNTGTGASNQGLLVRTDSTAVNNASAFAVYAGSAYRLMVKSGGNVGIGTSSPSYILDVTGASANVGKFKRDGAGTTEVIIDTSGSGDAQLVFADNGTDSWAIGRDNTNGNFVIAASGALGTSNATSIDSSGNTTFSGVVTVNSNIVANQISFDSGSNYLDDYEEGTWTPTLSGATTTTYTAQSGDYTKIGNFVFVNCSFEINSVGDGSTTTIAGLPYASNLAGSASAGGSVSYFANSAVTTLTISPELGDGATTLRFRGLSSTSSGFSGYLAMFQNSTRVDFHLVYKAT